MTHPLTQKTMMKWKMSRREIEPLKLPTSYLPLRETEGEL